MATERSAPVDQARDHLRGASRPAVTLLVYGEYRCPYTRMACRGVEHALREMPEADDLVAVLRHAASERDG